MFPLIIAASAILPFLPGLDGKLVFDDVPLIKDDPFYLEESNPFQCWNRSFWKIERRQGLYRPLTVFSYWADTRIYSPFANPDTGIFEQGFRITNLILHTLVSLLVSKLAQRLRLGRLAAFVAAMVFALHPIHVEAVTPAFGRGELLCALFFVAGLTLHTMRRKSLCRPAAAVCYMLSFMSKENGIALLPVCLLFELHAMPLAEWRPVPLLRRLGPLAAYLAAPATVFALRMWALGTLLPAKDYFMPAIDNVIALSPPLLRVVAAVRIQGIALAKFFWPAVLSHDYSYAQILPSESVWDPYAWLTLAMFSTAVFLFVRLSRRDASKVLFMAAAYIVLVLPAGNFFVTAGTIFAERLQYLPSLFLCLACATASSRISRKAPAATFTALALVMMALSVRTFHRTYAWRNEMTLAMAGIHSAPRSIKIWNNLSVQFSAIGDYQDAIIAVDKAIDIYPEYATGYANKGTYLAQLGLFEEAKENLRTALRLSVNHLQANYMLGLVYAEEGYPEKAVMVWERIQQYYPRDPKVAQAISLARQGRWKSKAQEESIDEE